jgi:hypothetical protein
MCTTYPCRTQTELRTAASPSPKPERAACSPTPRRLQGKNGIDHLTSALPYSFSYQNSISFLHYPHHDTRSFTTVDGCDLAKCCRFSTFASPFSIYTKVRLLWHEVRNCKIDSLQFKNLTICDKHKVFSFINIRCFGRLK